MTYDATQTGGQRELVFQPAAGRAGHRPTSHWTAGPPTTPARWTADIGPLAIGNFNDTMHGYGLDRQFRGEIRGLQLFGSRVGGRGALTLDAIQGHLH